MYKIIALILVAALSACTFVYVTDSEVGVDTNDDVRIFSGE